MILKNIIWEKDGLNIKLPKTLKLNNNLFKNGEDLNENINNYLSDKYGFLLISYIINY